MLKWRVWFVAALGQLTVVVASGYLDGWMQSVAVALIVAVFGLWTLAEWRTDWRRALPLSLLILVIYGAVAGVLAAFVA